MDKKQWNKTCGQKSKLIVIYHMNECQSNYKKKKREEILQKNFYGVVLVI